MPFSMENVIQKLANLFLTMFLIVLLFGLGWQSVFAENNPSQVPQSPVGLKVIDNVEKENTEKMSITITWAAPQPRPAGYFVYIGKESGNYDQKVDVGYALSTIINNLDKNKKYYISVTSYDPLGNESAYAAEKEFSAVK